MPAKAECPYIVRSAVRVLAVGVLALSQLPAAASLAEPQDNVVANDATPADGMTTIQLEELWRIGGEDDEENLLGVVDQVLIDDEGNVYLLDVQLVEVQVFDRQGNYVKSLGARGDGPGEVRMASDCLFMPDGTVGLVQSFPGRIVKVDLEGTPAGEIRPGGDDPTGGGFFALRSAASSGNHVVLSGARMTRGDNTRTARHFIASYEADGTEVHTFLGMTSERDFGSGEISEKDEFFPHRGGWALGPDGRIVVAPARNEYRLEIHAPDGRLERTFTRPYRSWKRTAAESALAKEMMMPFRRRNRGDIHLDMESTEPDIRDLRIDADGRIWVLPSRGVREQPEGIHSIWDVFDPTGRFILQAAMACEGEGLRDALFLPGAGLAVLVLEHAEAMFAFRGQGADNPDAEAEATSARPVEVICYRMKSE